MSLIQHMAVLATTWREDKVVAFESWLQKEQILYLKSPPLMNQHVTFVIPPDGSGEGWEASDLGDATRDKVVGWLKGSENWKYVEVSYGEIGSGVLRTNCGQGDSILRINKLQKFKAYVHNRLDVAGVPADPDPPMTKATGCRIGVRLDAVFKDFK